MGPQNIYIIIACGVRDYLSGDMLASKAKSSFHELFLFKLYIFYDNCPQPIWPRGALVQQHLTCISQSYNSINTVHLQHL